MQDVFGCVIQIIFAFPISSQRYIDLKNYVEHLWESVIYESKHPKLFKTLSYASCLKPRSLKFTSN